MSKKGQPATVFVGNIPFDTTEEHLKEIFSQVGVVSSFRLVYDQQTGKPKGFGFCEYEDAETAMSALRNLNGVEVNGRPLRVSLSEHDKSRVQEQTGQTVPQGKNSQGNTGGGGRGDGAASRQNVITERMTPQQVFDVMLNMKELIQKDEGTVRTLLNNDPNMTYALLQGQIMLGMVPAHVIPAGVPQVPIPATGGAPLPIGALPGGVNAARPIPMMPPADQAALLQQAQLAPNQGDQLQQLQMLMSLTPAQIEQLPPDQREVVLQLQRQVQSQLTGPNQPPPAAPGSMY